MAIHVMEEAKRCLQCKDPQCRKGCPINTNIPNAIRLLKEQKLNEAGKMLFENNPLSMICSLVCNHESQCEGHCVLGIKGAPVHFSAIENYISSTYAKQHEKKPVENNGMKVAVIGAGPAGITIAIELAKLGYQITIFDSKDKMGGVLRYGIPEFRLPKSTIDDLQHCYMDSKQIKFRPNTTIGGTITIDDLFRDGYKTVFCGTGVWRPRALGIKGETFGNVHFAINYLNNPDSYDLGDDVIVIGAGNSAIDVARTAVRNGSKNVTCFARGNKIRATEHEKSYATLEGVNFVTNKKPLEITDDGVIFVETKKNDDDSYSDINGSEKLYKADSVIIAVSQGAKDKLVSTTKGLKLNDKGLLMVDDEGRTTVPGVFASGDVTAGARTVVEAVAKSKLVANRMHEYMQTLQ